MTETLKPGDSVPVEGCHRVGNFPHGILTNPDSLALNPGYVGSSVPLASRKQDWINAFDENNLTVCEDNGDFAKINQPYFLNLHKKDDIPDPHTEAHRRWIFSITISNLEFNESELCASGLKGGCLYKAISIKNPCGTVFTWMSDLGSVSFDAKINSYMDDVTDDPTQCTDGLLGPCFCNASATGNISIQSFWDPDTMNKEYLLANNIPFDSVVVATITLTVRGTSISRNITQATSLFTLTESENWVCYDDGIPSNYTIQTAFGVVGVVPGELPRWVHNYNLAERPQCWGAPPGQTWPEIIDDPSHPDY